MPPGLINSFSKQWGLASCDNDSEGKEEWMVQGQGRTLANPQPCLVLTLRSPAGSGPKAGLKVGFQFTNLPVSNREGNGRHRRLVRIRPAWCTLSLVYSWEKLIIPSKLPVTLMPLVHMLVIHRLPFSPPPKKKQNGKKFPQEIRKVLNQEVRGRIGENSFTFSKKMS